MLIIFTFMEFLFDFYKPDIEYSIKNIYFINYTLSQENNKILYLATGSEIFSQYLLYLHTPICNVILKYLMLLIVRNFTYRPINLVYLEVINGKIQMYIETPLYLKRCMGFISHRCISYQIRSYMFCTAITALLLMEGISALRYST